MAAQRKAMSRSMRQSRGIRGAAWVLAILFAASTSGAADRPNVLIVMMDDVGFADLGTYGSEIETPNIDGLAENGLRYTNFTVTGV